MTLASDRLRIVSHFPGRLRVRAEAFRIRPEIAEEIAQRLAEEAGVIAAKTSPLTGSLVVDYEPREVELPILVELLVRAGGLRGIEVDAPLHLHPALLPGARVRDAFAHVDAKARAKMRGSLDMRVAVPGALAAGGVALLLMGRRRVPEWYDLIFWGFVTFVNLNPSTIASADERRQRAVAPPGAP